MKKREDSQAFTMPPNRAETHRIDTEAVRLVRTQLTSDWVERSVEERDYGIDMMLEAFDEETPTGILVLLQIKGRKGSFGSDEVSLSVPVKTLLYARMFQTPFFLLHASIEDKKVHFVWLQKYINTRLSLDSPRWNRQEHVNIYFPKDNLVDEGGLEKIRSLVTYVAHRDMGITFLGHLIWLQHHIDNFHHGRDKHEMEQAICRLKEISKLESFLATYEDNSEELDLEELRRALEKTKAYGAFDHGHAELIDTQLTCLHAIEMMFLSKDEQDAFVAENLETDLPY